MENIILKKLEILSRSPSIKSISKALGEENTYLVGGCLRDLFLDRIVKDVDCTTPLSPEVIIEKLTVNNIQTIATGLKHQTVTAVPIKREPNIEITSFRGPKMSPQGGLSLSKTIEEDLSYRDFTINALAYSLKEKKIFSTPSSLEDLKNKIIKTVGSPTERFAEDPLRVMRMIRFSCLKDFSIDPNTLNSAKNFIESLKLVSIERIRDEIIKILISEQPVKGFNLMAELGILKIFLPEVDCCIGFEQNEYHNDDVYIHTMKVLEKTEADLILRLAALLHDIGKTETLSIDPDKKTRHFYKHEIVGVEMSKNLLKRLRFSNLIIEQVGTLIATHMRPLEAGAGGLRRLLRDTGDLFPQWRRLKEVDASSTKLNPDELQQRLKDFDQAIEKVKAGPEVSPLKNLAIKGKDLVSLGLKPSPLFKEILNYLHEKVLDQPELNVKEKLLEMTAEYLKEKGQPL